MKRVIIITAAVVAALTAGCVQTKVKSPNGWEVSRTAFGLNTAIGRFQVQQATNGTFDGLLEGYSSDGTQTIRAVAEGVASGLNPIKR